MLYRPPPSRAGAKAVLFVISVAMVATGLWLFVAGLFLESETNIWFVISGGWLIGLGGDRFWTYFLAAARDDPPPSLNLIAASRRRRRSRSPTATGSDPVTSSATVTATRSPMSTARTGRRRRRTADPRRSPVHAANIAKLPGVVACCAAQNKRTYDHRVTVLTYINAPVLNAVD